MLQKRKKTSWNLMIEALKSLLTLIEVVDGGLKIGFAQAQAAG